MSWGFPEHLKKHGTELYRCTTVPQHSTVSLAVHCIRRHQGETRPCMLRWVEEASGAFLKIQFNNILSPVYVYVLPRISPPYLLTLESVCPPLLRGQTFRLLHESHVPVFLFIGINIGQETVGYCLWKYIFPAKCIDQEMDSSPHFIASMSLYGCFFGHWQWWLSPLQVKRAEGTKYKIQGLRS